MLLSLAYSALIIVNVGYFSYKAIVEEELIKYWTIGSIAAAILTGLYLNLLGSF